MTFPNSSNNSPDTQQTTDVHWNTNDPTYLRELMQRILAFSSDKVSASIRARYWFYALPDYLEWEALLEEARIALGLELPEGGAE